MSSKLRSCCASIRLMSVMSATALALTSIASPAMAADLTGTSVNVTWLFPDVSTIYKTQTFAVGSGVELTCAGGGVGGGLCSGFVDSSTIDLGGDTLSLAITGGTAPWNGAAFNGFEFSGLSAGGLWSGYSLTTNFAGLGDSRITFSPDAVRVNMQGIAPTEGQSFTITLLSAAVPEPATWAMMLVGFGAIGATMRFRQRKTALA